MQNEELIRLQVGLEYRVEGDGLIPFPGSTEQARFILYRHPGDFMRYYRIDVPLQMRLELERIDGEQVFHDPKLVRTILNAYSLCTSSGLYESCYFTQVPQADKYLQVAQEDRKYVIKIDGQPVCWAWSERSNEQCAEVAVETLPAYQRRGFARQAVSALAAAEMKRGRVVFYSYEMENLASRELAHSLGVAHFASCAAFD